MKWFYVCFLICFILPMVSAELFYEIDVHYVDGELKIIESDVVFSRIDRANVYLENDSSIPFYSVELLGKAGDLIYRERFSVPILRVIHFGENGSIVSGELEYATDVSFRLFLPYRNDVNSFVFYDSNNESIETIDVSYSSKDESKEPFIPPSSAEKNGTFDSDSLFYVLLFVMLLIVISFVLYVFLRKKK